MKLLLVLALFSWTTGIFAQVDVESLVATIKSNLAQSKVNIRKYEWIETTKAYVKDELKSTKQNQCYYSVDGKLTKVETGGTEQAKTPGGIRGKVIENKKDDMIDYISKAADIKREPGNFTKALAPSDQRLIPGYFSILIYLEYSCGAF